MKKMIAWVLLFAMLLGTFAGCGGAGQTTGPNAESGNNAAAAIEYLKAIYKDYGAKTFADFERPGTLRIDGVPYEVVWTADVAEDLVKVVAGENGNVTIDVNDQCETETPYNLTATVTDEAGNTASHSWNYVLPAVASADIADGDQIVLFNPADGVYVTGTDYLYTSSSGSQKHELVVSENKADALPMVIQTNDDETISFVADGLYLFCDGTDVMFVAEQGEFTKFVLEPCEGGQLIRCATANYSGKAQYLELYSGYMTCYGYNAEKVGLYAFVLEDAEGASGKVQEAALVEKPEDGEAVDPTDIEAVINAAYALKAGASLKGIYTLTGKITSIDSAWSDQYKNITVTIVVPGYEDKPIQCFRITGDGAKDLAVGDEITATGELLNYNGKIEFNQGCVLGDLAAYNAANGGETVSDTAKIMDEAFKLASGAYLPYTATLTGVITDVVTPYSSKYNNITVNIEVDGYAGKTIQCYRLKGDGADNLALFDTITVTGKITNYKGKIEFDSGCKLVKVVKSTAETVTDAAKIMAEAKALGSNERLPYMVTMTGTVHSILTKYSATSNIISVAMWVDTGDSVNCWELTGEDVENVNINDVITVNGVISNVNGEIRFIPGSQMVDKVDHDKPAASWDAKKIFKDAEGLHNGAQLLYNCNLTGKITKVNTPYSEKNNNISVTIEVEGYEDKPIRCYNLMGSGIETLNAGDVIIVSGAIGMKNDALGLFGGGLIAITVQTDPPKAPTDPKQIVDEAFALPVGETLGYIATLTGPIVSIDTAWSDKYQNITVSITVYGSDGAKTLQCYRLSGDGAKDLAVGDTITVTGIIKRYSSKVVEFDQGCKLLKVVKGTVKPVEIPEGATPAQIIELAYGLAVGNRLADTCSLTGVITSIKTPYDSGYKNISVVMVVGGDTAHPILCYRLSGDGAADLAVGDTITVSGTIKNHLGTIEFDQGCKLLNVVKGEGGGSGSDDTGSDDTGSDDTGSEFEEPAAGPLTVAQAKELAANLGADVYSTNVYSITGTVKSIDNATYGNITIEDATGTFSTYGIDGWKDLETKPAVGDTVTITGKVGSFGTTPQMKYPALTIVSSSEDTGSDDTGSSGEGETTIPATLAEQIEAAKALADGGTLPYNSTIKGTITDDPQPSSYTEGSYKFTVSDGTNSILCYYVPVAGGVPTKGDTITVTGPLTKYNSTTIEFTSSATATLAGGSEDSGDDSGSSDEDETTIPATLAEQIAAAKALANGGTLPYNSTIKGTIIDDPQPSSYTEGSYKFTVSDGTNSILCYYVPVAGGVPTKGATITVTGPLTKYNSTTIEFTETASATLG